MKLKIILCLFASATVASDTTSESKDSKTCASQPVCVNDAVTTADGVKIYWDLDNKDQFDPDLIQAIRDVVLIPPDKKPLNLT